MTTQTEMFDDAVRSITQERGEVYGHPAGEFHRIRLIQDLLPCKHIAIKHAINMIVVKLVRLCYTPTQMDSIIDVAGYARTIAMINDEEKEHG